jgi:soluble lytic murein transglycosylase-like protein
MRPNLSGMTRVLGRIEEIERKVRPRRDEPTPEKSGRFVDILAREEVEAVAKPSSKKSAENLPRSVPSPEAEWESQLSFLAAEYGVDEELVRAVVRIESGGRPDAVSHKGAMGLMQLMPGTARMLGVEDPYDPVQNLEGGIKYLSQLSDKYNGDLVKTLAAYNAGPGRVDSYGGVPPFEETQRYVRNVLALYERNSGRRN